MTRHLATAVLVVSLIGCGSGSRSSSSSTVTPPITQVLVVSPSVVPAGSEGTHYSVDLSVSGGAAPYDWSLAAGSLPPGVAGLPGTGDVITISGTPTAAGVFRLQVEVLDSAGVRGVQDLALTVAPANPNTWSKMSTVGAPSPRESHTAVWTGDEMLVWGGRDDAGTSLGDGAAYDPVSDSWRAISSVGAPSARQTHTAVWTGDEMIVWGGYDGRSFLGDGAAYDPGTDTWRALAAASAPEARNMHTATWTGQVMLVYGGQGAWPPGVPFPNSMDRVFSDGGAYDPGTDAWTPIADSNPSGTGVASRRGHTATWTGTELLVWGGRSAFALTIDTHADGGAYDPATNTWRLLSSASAPTGRHLHTAVWSGSEMVVWGGQEAALASGTTTGGAYASATDAWRGTPVLRAISGRYGHVAGWTGAEMIVWGGSTGAGHLGEGWIYDPNADAWRGVVRTGEPTARTGATAVWSGVRLLVWGGRGGASNLTLDDGGAYAP